jgi:beta-lactamase regulating signal transducer with metallopeptidase domain
VEPPIVQDQPQHTLLDHPWGFAFLGYVFGTAAFLVLVALGRARLRGWVRGGRAVTDGRVVRAFASARLPFMLWRRPALIESGCVHTPITLGALTPVVLLPEGLAQGLSDAELRAIAIHELAHVKRHDPLVLGLASLVRAVLFFHPLVWLACRQVSNLAEASCDDAVLDATGEPVSYAKMLARLALNLPRHALSTELSAGIVLSKSAFLRRVEAILVCSPKTDPGVMRVSEVD